MTDTKYGDRIPEDAWVDQEEDVPDRARVKTHTIELYYDDEPGTNDNYQRTKYELRIAYTDTGEPYALYAISHRWKGNYWRDMLDLDYRDLPTAVKETVASKLPVDHPDDLQHEHRLIPEGGENRWQKHHKPRVESLDGTQMWGLSALKEGLERLERAAESFDEDSQGERLSNRLVELTQKSIKVVDPDGGSDD